MVKKVAFHEILDKNNINNNNLNHLKIYLY